MTIAERNNKLKHYITCLKCRVSGKECDDNCATQYEAGTMGEIIENLESISKILEKEPCEDAVSRQAVLEVLKDKWNMFSDANDAMQESIDTIEALRPVTAEPKTGHWIYDNFNWRCSECNETPKTMGYVGTADFMTEHFKFCNHCGARMIEPQESEVEDGNVD